MALLFKEMKRYAGLSENSGIEDKKPLVYYYFIHIVDFNIANDEKGEWRKFRTPITEYDAIYEMKATAPINTEAHANVQTQLRAGRIKFLIEERVARAKLLATKRGASMRPEERAEYLKPFTLTSILKEEMQNLREENDGINIILRQYNKSINKDKFSASTWALHS